MGPRGPKDFWAGPWVGCAVSYLSRYPRVGNNQGASKRHLIVRSAAMALAKNLSWRSRDIYCSGSTIIQPHMVWIPTIIIRLIIIKVSPVFEYHITLVHSN